MAGAPPLRIELYSDILLAVGHVGGFADEGRGLFLMFTIYYFYYLLFGIFTKFTIY